MPLLGSTAQRSKRQRDRRGAVKKAAGRGRAAFELPLLGSNQDSPDPESGVLPVTPRGSDTVARSTTPRCTTMPVSSRLTYTCGLRLAACDQPYMPVTPRCTDAVAQCTTPRGERRSATVLKVDS